MKCIFYPIFTFIAPQSAMSCFDLERVRRFNDLIFKQLLAIILQTNLQSHQLFSTDRQNTQLISNIDSSSVLKWDNLDNTWGIFTDGAQKYISFCQTLNAFSMV